MIKVYAKPKLRHLRMKMGYTQEDIAKELNYSPAAYGKIELRRNGISPKRTKVFLSLFNVSFDDIFELIDSQTEKSI